MAKEFIEKTKVELFPQKGGWYYVRVPKFYTEMSRDRADRGLVPIYAKVGSTEWRTSLLPYGDGTHFIALNAKVMKKESIVLDQKIEIMFRFR